MILEKFTHLLNRTVFENKYPKCIFVISSGIYRTYTTGGAIVLKGWSQNCAIPVKVSVLVNKSITM
jgi:hypothetical protein